MDIDEQYDRIYRYCLHRLGSPAQAEDVTQEAFLRWLSAAGYREEGRALGYLYTVARNLCADQYRRPKAEPLPEDLAAPDGEPGVLDRLALAQALAALTDQERDLVLMRYMNEAPVGAVAAALGISRFAVYRRTAAALDKLRTLLREDGP